MIDLPSYEPREAVAASQLAARLPVTFGLAGMDVKAVMLGSAVRRLPSDHLWVLMRARGHRIHVAIDRTVCPPSAVKHWPNITALPLDASLREILLDVVLRDLAVQVQHWCGHRPIWSLADVTESFPCAIQILRVERPNDVLGLVEFDADGLQWIADCCSALPVVRATVDDLPLILDMRIARIGLTLAELQQLAEGDVILLDDPSVDQDGAMTVLMDLSGSTRFRASIRNCRLTVLSAVDRLMDQPEPLPPESFDSITLSVNVDVGRLTMPLRELRELAVGQVLDLGFDATANVCLRVNGQVVATGELVRIAERTGVRLLDIRLSRAE
ncbi:FliM/FliN family flagellar motor switch protein [Bradyrhizobium sp. CB3481]|uniref:FliM/FliN family flagellar motor switch protein n=1 Tax=Bradyrhizobium sp. CB3481 TaxID=3039158 RepID=UPI0024B21050|nr:FliM/FliN family flagellar motor switch protein [Bradyrhizobium sp. CB3481]WFU14914.1 FliM/FliN family flagellar motor switch protein [Bradyrhizobium sp. CB3481]